MKHIICFTHIKCRQIYDLYISNSEKKIFLRFFQVEAYFTGVSADRIVLGTGDLKDGFTSQEKVSNLPQQFHRRTGHSNFRKTFLVLVLMLLLLKVEVMVRELIQL